MLWIVFVSTIYLFFFTFALARLWQRGCLGFWEASVSVFIRSILALLSLFWFYWWEKVLRQTALKPNKNTSTELLTKHWILKCFKPWMQWRIACTFEYLILCLWHCDKRCGKVSRRNYFVEVRKISFSGLKLLVLSPHKTSGICPPETAVLSTKLCSLAWQPSKRLQLFLMRTSAC